MFVMKKKELDIKVRYYTRHNKSYLGDSPIMVRLYVNGERACLGQVGYSVQPCYLVRNRVVSSASLSAEINDALQDLESRVWLLAEQLSAKGTLRLAHLREALSPSRQPSYSILSVYERILAESTERYQSGDIAKTTYQRHLLHRVQLVGYLHERYGREDVPLASLVKDDMVSFEHYLKGTLGLHHNSAIKSLSFFHQAVLRAVEEDLLDKSPFGRVRFPKVETDRGFLDEASLDKLSTVELSDDKLRIVRDAFLFSCYTGLSYSDISRLTQENILTMGGEQWIVLRRKKTNVLSNVPLISISRAILSPYLAKATSSSEPVFPLPTNPTTNHRLREIGKLCGLRQHLTYHLSRHTFATMALTKGVSLDTIGNILGHRKLSTTQIYARVLPSKVNEEMRSLDRRLQSEQKESLIS